MSRLILPTTLIFAVLRNPSSGILVFLGGWGSEGNAVRSDPLARELNLRFPKCKCARTDGSHGAESVRRDGWPSCFKRTTVFSRNAVMFRRRSAMWSPLCVNAAGCGHRHLTSPMRILHLRAKAAMPYCQTNVCATCLWIAGLDRFVVQPQQKAVRLLLATAERTSAHVFLGCRQHKLISPLRIGLLLENLAGLFCFAQGEQEARWTGEPRWSFLNSLHGRVKPFENVTFA